MAKQFGGGRRNSRTSFGKRQDADDAFRKKKKERRGDEGTRGRNDEGTRGRSEEGPRGRGGFRGSSYSGGARKFSTGRRERRNDETGERKTFRSGKPDGERSSNRGGSFNRSGDKPFGNRRRSFDDKPSGDKRRSYGDKPFRERSEKKSYGEKRSYGDRSERGERKSFGDKKPFRKDKPERRSFVESKIERHRERVERPQHEETKPAVQQSEDGLIRLNKFISNSGVCSRREADELIKMGVITVNGTTITEMGYKVKPTDDVRHDGKKLTAEKPVYILLNKPKGFITTTDDPQERNTVMQLVAGACKERVYPVGRLDRNTTGLLLLTNDGDLTDKLTHPSFNAKKIYKVELDKPLTKADFQKIVDGVQLEEGKAIVDDLAIVSDDNMTVGIELHIGWNHVVRRIFNALEYEVVKLDRVVYAGLDKKDLKRGQWRFLKNDEIVRLKHFK
jgi:23S rRNA pseudouridine2605 synthase